MTTYHELLAQRGELEKQIEHAREEEFRSVVADLKQKMADYSITLADLGIDEGRGETARARSVVPAKYRDPVSGATWSGRGKPPRWIAGRERDLFALS